MKILPYECSTLALFASTTANPVASVGFLLSMALSAVGQCQLMDLFTSVTGVTSNLSVSAILKATVRTFLGEECVWVSTLETARVTAMQTRILAGTRCPGSWWKKYPLLSRRIRNITVRHARLLETIQFCSSEQLDS